MPDYRPNEAYADQPFIQALRRVMADADLMAAIEKASVDWTLGTPPGPEFREEKNKGHINDLFGRSANFFIEGGRISFYAGKKSAFRNRIYVLCAKLKANPKLSPLVGDIFVSTTKWMEDGKQFYVSLPKGEGEGDRVDALVQLTKECFTLLAKTGPGR